MYIYKSKRQKWRLQAALVVAISCIQFPVLGAGVVVDLLKDSPKAPPRHESFVKTVVFKYGFDNDVLTGLSSQATGGRDCSKGGRCLNEIYDEHFRRFDLKHAKSNSSQFGANFKTNDIKIDTVYRSAVNRALTRAVVDTLSITPMLRAVFEGKIDLDLDVGSFFESGPPLEISEPMRPVYRVALARPRRRHLH